MQESEFEFNDQDNCLNQAKNYVQKDDSELQLIFNLPEARQLMNFSRPLDYEARIMAKDSTLKKLPLKTQQYMNQLLKIDSRSFISSKKILGGKGKSLYQYFQQPHFKLIYQKQSQNRNEYELNYDFTAKIKILECTNDYNEKLYKKLQTHQSSENITKISFDSKFQSGNLAYAYQFQKNSQYYLLLQNDSNTHGFNNWFFFSVKNRFKQNITIHIFNLIKQTSLFKSGMKISVFSEKSYEKYGKGWYKGGENIIYTNTKIQRVTKQNQYYYSLTFSYYFQEVNDTVYFALNNPYTYTRLSHFLYKIEEKFQEQKIFFYKKCVGYSIANNAIPAIIIKQKINLEKKAILILARQHPAQTVSSFIVEGLIQFFTQKSREATYLLNHFRFIIIPMINPDGVIYGNSRCNLAGFDLNRQWGSQIIKEFTPQTFCIKKYIKSIQESTGIECMIDLHGHSKKMNSFFYGCPNEDKSKMRLFSVLMSKVQKNFDVYSCKYKLTKDKVNTIRWQLFKEKINSFTLQNSYFGKQKSNVKQHYTDLQLKEIGKSLMKSLYLMYSQELKIHLMRKQVFWQIQHNIEKYQEQQAKNKQDSGSDSDPEGDFLDQQQRISTLLNNNKTEIQFKPLLNIFQSITSNKSCEKKYNPQNKMSGMNIQILKPKTIIRQKINKIIQIKKIKNQRMIKQRVVEIKNVFQKSQRPRAIFNSLPTQVQKYDQDKIMYRKQRKYQKHQKLNSHLMYLKQITISNKQKNESKAAKRMKSELNESSSIQRDENKSSLDKYYNSSLNLRKQFQYGPEKIKSKTKIQQTNDITIIQQFYIKNRKQRDVYLPNPSIISRKVSRQNSRFDKIDVQQISLNQQSKQKKMDQTKFQNAEKNQFLITDQNSVFYHFPIL